MSDSNHSLPIAPPLDEQAVRALLPRTWHAFFGRFGRLTGVQRCAVAPIVRGEAVLANAPTASGKTEALLAPLSERLLERRVGPAPGGIGLLVVAPTRALCNDLLRRLQGPLRRVRLSVDIKSGDSPELNERALPEVLITTPESLDSLLVRHPTWLRSVVAVVLDEVHLVVRSPRGDQLRALLTRLDRVATEPVQRCAASATTPDAAAVARLFLGAHPTLAQDPNASQRAIVATLAPAVAIDEAVERIAEYARSHRKLLVFANARSQVEALGAQLSSRRADGGAVFVHHGSLARGERLRVEHAFLQAPQALCVATMTLELGIDIGDVDGAVLLAPPPNVASLLQRVGRANRGEQEAHVLCLHAGPFEVLRFEHLLACADRGALFPEQVAFRPTLIAQQALSLLFQNPRGWVAPPAVYERLPEDARALYTLADCEAILRAMAGADLVRAVQHGRYVAEVKGQRLYERGQLHSMISDRGEVEVVDETTGRVMGSVRFGGRERDGVRAGVRPEIALGGRAHAVTRVRDDRVYVQSSGGGGGEALFIAQEAPRYSRALARDFAAHMGIGEGDMPLEPVGEGRWRLWHLQGTVWGRLLRSVLAAGGHRPKSGGPFHAVLEDPPHDGATLGREAELRVIVDGVLADSARALARVLQPGPFLDVVPDDVVLRWVRASVQPDAFARIMSQMHVRDERPAP